MRTLLTSIAVVTLALGSGGAVAAADPVNAAVKVDRTSMTVGDRIAMSVIVDADPGVVVSEPTIARQIGPFEVVRTQAVQKTTQGAQARYTYKYTITAWIVGDLVLPSIGVGWVGANGATGTAQTGEMQIRVLSVVQPGEDASDIKPLKPQLDLPEAGTAVLTRLAFGLLGALAAAALAGVVFWLVLRRRDLLRPAEQLTPVRRALRELDDLAAQRLPEQGQTAEHYARLTASLRRYAVERFGVQPGRTSREVRDALERAGLERMQAAAIYEILREGDEVRFRHVTPYPAHAQNAVRSALQIIRRAASAEEYETAAVQPQ